MPAEQCEFLGSHAFFFLPVLPIFKTKQFLWWTFLTPILWQELRSLQEICLQFLVLFTDVPLRYCLVLRWKKNNSIIAPYSLVKIDICMVKWSLLERQVLQNMTLSKYVYTVKSGKLTGKSLCSGLTNSDKYACS